MLLIKRAGDVRSSVYVRSLVLGIPLVFDGLT